MNPTDPEDARAGRQQPHRRSPWIVLLKVIGILIIGVIVLLGLLLGTCLLMLHR